MCRSQYEIYRLSNFGFGNGSALQSKKFAVMSGALTPTEIFSARQAGADMVKIFPISVCNGRNTLSESY